MHMAAASWSPQSQRTEPNTSPVRHSLCTRTSTGLSGEISPLYRAMCVRPSLSALKAAVLKWPQRVGSSASAILVTVLPPNFMRCWMSAATEQIFRPCSAA